MSDKKVRVLVISAAIFLLLSGAILYIVFDKQGMANRNKTSYINYNVNDYVEVEPVVFNEYTNVYNNINVSKIILKNINKELTEDFIEREEELIAYITGYYNEIKKDDNYIPINTVYSSIKTQINGAVLSICYQLDFKLDEEIFSDNIKSYIITLNIDLATNKILINEDLLSKYSYTKDYIADKLFTEDVLIGKGEVVIDKTTNISLTKNDVERKKEEYVNKIITEFDNIADMYIENNTLVLVYDAKELKGIFFDNRFDTDIKFRYLK